MSVSYIGPIFDGRAQAMLTRGINKWEDHLASVGADYVQAQLERVLRKETPYYRLQVASKEMEGAHVIQDGGVIYGPWLEGTGSRNRTTRFKGYGTFRLITQKLDAEAISIIQPYVDATVAEINGGG